MGLVDRQRDHDWRQTMWLSIDLDGDIERIGLLLESEAEQMALRRAAMLEISLRLSETPCSPLYKTHVSPDRATVAMFGAAPLRRVTG